jgi:tRNA (cmo5U34)-methyltransferase
MIIPPIADFSGERALNYERLISIWIPGYEQLHAMLPAILHNFIPDSASLLIAGSGSGKELEVLGKANCAWQLLGVDPSADMMRLAQERIANLGLSDRVNFYRGLVSELSEDKLYDAATLILVMHFFPDDGSKLALLASISRRLKSDAPFILVDTYGNPQSVQFELLLNSLKNYVLKKGIPQEEVEERVQKIRQELQVISQARLVSLLEMAGFQVIERFFTAFLVGGWIAKKRS